MRVLRRYTVGATVFEGACSGAELDAVEVPHGFRSLEFDANEGFHLNNGAQCCCYNSNCRSRIGWLNCLLLVGVVFVWLLTPAARHRAFVVIWYELSFTPCLP